MKRACRPHPDRPIVPRWASALGLVLPALFVLTACHTPAPRLALPPAAYANHAQAVALLNVRRDAISSLQARATVRFTPATGASQTLDAQLVHHAPDQARLRADKLNHNLLDLTVTPEGVWTAVSPRVLREAPNAEAELVRLARVLPLLLRGPDYAAATPAPASRHKPQTLTLRWDQGLSTDLHAPTLTPRRFTLPHPEGEHGHAVAIEPDYTLYPADADRLPWLRSAVITGAFGRIELTFHDVLLNQPLNPRAFRPPRRAITHPR